MKTMTCRQLGGACDKKITAETFDEIAEMCKQHSMELVRQNDIPHIKALEKMRAMMQTPEIMQQWFEGKRNEFKAMSVDK